MKSYTLPVLVLSQQKWFVLLYKYTMAPYVPGALRIQQGQTESLVSWTLCPIGSQTGKQMHEHTNQMKRLWRKSQSVINGDSDLKGQGWGQWSGMALLKPWTSEVKYGSKRRLEKSGGKVLTDEPWMEPVQGQAEALWGWGPRGCEENSGTKATGLWETGTRFEGQRSGQQNYDHGLVDEVTCSYLLSHSEFTLLFDHFLIVLKETYTA